MSKARILGVIPARYKSSRFEGKPLAQIRGVPMIKRTYQQAIKATILDQVLVATDDSRIHDFCRAEQIPVAMTSENCLTGTDRIAEIAETHVGDLYINIQGDEPVVDPSAISQIATAFSQFGEQYIAYNLYKLIDDVKEIQSNTIIKTIVNEQDELMYMSRLPVPYSQSGVGPDFKQQIPVYGYTRNALQVFTSQGKTCNEQFEDIEMLRFVDLGHKVKMLETRASSIAVDIPSDIVKVENFLDQN